MAPNFSKATQTAQKVLKDNSVENPPTPIVDIAENSGLKVREVSFGKYSDQVTGYIDLKRSVIYVNKNDSNHRKVFTIAHELGHYLLHRAELERDPKISILLRKPLGAPDPNPLEQEANAFAAEVLVPLDILEKYIKKDITQSSILADIFGVSREVISYRLKDKVKNGYI